ncbi:MAG: energy-coupling factor transporter ATPase [Synergistetes bacterium]|nr:MAG: ABC transporter related protein [bacterium 42_11]MBC7331662.1 energy-coupling factor transporter ATPase [Synergistota bacterium]MDK2872009.1 energy-coupling factor transport system ATP-binding protein [bacterium]
MAIEVKNVSFFYSIGTPFEKKALENISFSLEMGENMGILGPTGSGKSTLIQLLNALLIPTKGEVLIDGLNTRERKNGSKIRELVGVVFQYPENQFFEDTVYEEIAFGAKNLRLSKEEVDRRVREAIAVVGLPEAILDKSPFELSGGEKRKVAIASILVRKPKYLVFDEPFAGMDYPGTEALVKFLKSLRGTVSLIVVTHTLDELLGLVDKIMFLDNGKMKAFGPVKDIIHFEELRKYVPLAELISLLEQKGLNFQLNTFELDHLEEEIVRNVLFS